MVTNKWMHLEKTKLKKRPGFYYQVFNEVETKYKSDKPIKEV